MRIKIEEEVLARLDAVLDLGHLPEQEVRRRYDFFLVQALHRGELDALELGVGLPQLARAVLGLGSLVKRSELHRQLRRGRLGVPQRVEVRAHRGLDGLDALHRGRVLAVLGLELGVHAVVH